MKKKLLTKIIEEELDKSSSRRIYPRWSQINFNHFSKS